MFNAKIIAIANQKGGVGKTTTAINLGACLAQAGHPTLLVDLDAQANATLGLGLSSDQIKATLFNVLVDRVSGADAVHETQIEGLKLIPSHADLAGAEVMLQESEHRETILRRALEPLRGSYEYILIDCPPSLGLVTLNGLAAADTVLIPIQAEYYAVAGVGLLLNTLALVARELNKNLRVEGAVLTMVDSRAALSQQVVESVRGLLRDRVFETLVPRSVRLAEAPSHGLPISLYDPKGKGTEAYKALAEELVLRSPAQKAPAPAH
jgi:chromosome partitioning protein